MSRPEIEFSEEDHKYLINGEEYPSVTRIISATVPKDLTWWGMEVGIAGCVILRQRGKFPGFNVARIKDALKEEKLTTNHIYRARGESGTSIHKAFERYAQYDEVPDLDDFPEYDHNRISSLADWLLNNRPEFLESEVKTASVEYRYAGTLDARILFHSGEYKGKVCLVDLKTSKGVYPESHFPQLEAYEHAEIECGADPTDYRLILHLPDGAPASLHRSVDSFDDFRVLLDHYNAIVARRERLKIYKAELREVKKRERAAARAAEKQAKSG